MAHAELCHFHAHWDPGLHCVVLDYGSDIPRPATLRAGLELARHEISRRGAGRVLVDGRLLGAIVELAATTPERAGNFASASWSVSDQYLEVIGR